MKSVTFLIVAVPGTVLTEGHDQPTGMRLIRLKEDTKGMI